MKTRFLSAAVVVLCGTLAPAGWAQPAIQAVENNYSYLFPGLPNYGIAQGSIFAIFGSNLASDASMLQTPPLKTSLDGVSVQISVNGTMTQALLYYVTPNQVGGILPSNTPLGVGTVTVSSGGQTSLPAPILVVQTAFGIVTADGSGQGPAAAFDSNSNPVTAANSANSGDTITLWGSGLGPVSGDESVPRPGNLANIPIEVDIGGVPAAVKFHGRSNYPGLDQINAVVPGGPAGCFVSVVVRSGEVVSNSATIPIAVSGRTCSDPALGPVQVLSGKSSYDTGSISVTQMSEFAPREAGAAPALIGYGIASGVFQQTPPAPGSTHQLGYGPASPSPGSCVVRPFSETPTSGVPLSSIVVPTPLDAGPAINLGSSAGTVSVPAQSGSLGHYSLTTTVGVDVPPLLPPAGGALTIDNGVGGSAVGGFSQQFNVPPPLVWTNITSIPFIDRTNGVTVTWTGGDPQGVVLIDGESWGPATGSPGALPGFSSSFGVQFFCAAMISAHQFTIPASALLAMPPYAIPADGGVFPEVTLNAQSFSLFSAQGLDGGIFSAGSTNTTTVPYQ